MCISFGFVKNPSVKYYSTNGVLRFLVSSIIPFSQMRILFRDTRKYTQTVQDNSKMLSKGSVWNYLTYHNYAIFNYLCTGDNQILLSRLIHIAEWTWNNTVPITNRYVNNNMHQICIGSLYVSRFHRISEFENRTV